MPRSLYIKKNPINLPPYEDVSDVALSALSALLINGYIYSLKEEKKYLTMNRPGLLYPAFCDLNLNHPVDGLWWWPARKVVLAACNGSVYSIDRNGSTTLLTGVTLTVGLTNFAQVGDAGTVAFMASGGPLVYTDDLVTLKNPQGLGVPTAATHVTYMDDHVIANEVGTGKFKWAETGKYTADIVTGSDSNKYMCYLNHIASSSVMGFSNGILDPTGYQVQNLTGTAFGVVSSVSLNSGSFENKNAAGTLNLSSWNDITFDLGMGALYATGLPTLLVFHGGYPIFLNYRSSTAVSSGKVYWEVHIDQIDPSGGAIFIGVKTYAENGLWLGNDAFGWSYRSTDGKKMNNNSASSYGSSYTAGDTIGVALDMTGGTIEFYKNNVSQGVAYTGLTGPMYPANSSYVYLYSTSGTYNFGATAFAYTPPTGYSAFGNVHTTLKSPTKIGDVNYSPLLSSNNYPITGDNWAAYWQLTTAPANKTWKAGDSYSAGWAALNFGTMEAKGDVLQAIDSRFDMIILFGKSSIEYWYNDGVSPFSKYEGMTSEGGTIAPYSVIFDGNVHWMIDGDKNLVQLINRAPKVVSNPFASILQEMSTTADSFAVSVKSDGRNFLVLTFPTENITLAYDVENGMWQGQWGLWNPATADFDMWIPRCYCKCPEWGFDLVGDRRSGKIYKISQKYSTDADQVLRIVKRTGMVDYGIKYKKRSNRIRITIERGIGLNDSGAVGMSFVSGNIDPTGETIQNAAGTATAIVTSVYISSGSFKDGDAAGILHLSSWNSVNFAIGAGTHIYVSRGSLLAVAEATTQPTVNTTNEPLFTMKSRIDGQVWGDEVQGGLGQAGDVYSIVEFRQNGIFRYRQDEYSFSDAVPLVIVEAEEEIEVLGS